MSSPLVSVLMPAYNAGRYVGQSIESVLSQTLEDLELIIVDDGSTDESIAIARSYRDRRIRIVHHERNLGLAAARNTCLNSASGEYVAWLDADDRCHPDRLEAQVGKLEREPEIGLCGTWVKTIGTQASYKWRYPIDSATLKARLLFDDPFATSSIMLRRRILVEHDLRFDESYPPAEDYDLWEKLSGFALTANIPRFLTYYRLHPHQISRLMSAQQADSIWRIQSRQLAELGIEASDEEKEVHLKLGVRWDFLGDEAWLTRALRWLERLRAANSATRYFPQPAFDATLADRWYRVCRANTRLGLRAWKAFGNAPLAADYCGGVFRRSRLALEAIFSV